MFFGGVANFVNNQPLWTFGLCSLCSKGGDCETESRPTGENLQVHRNLDVEAGEEKEANHQSSEELRNAEPLTFALLEVVTIYYFLYLHLIKVP